MNNNLTTYINKIERDKRKNLVSEIIKYITIDKVADILAPNPSVILVRFDSRILQITLDYVIDYEKKNNQKISFLKLGCFIDRQKNKTP